MKDFLNKELDVGDLVIVAHAAGYSGETEMKVTRVVGLKEIRNKILTENDSNFGYDPDAVYKI
jgi:hypothetical protein